MSILARFSFIPVVPMRTSFVASFLTLALAFGAEPLAAQVAEPMAAAAVVAPTPQLA